MWRFFFFLYTKLGFLLKDWLVDVDIPWASFMNYLWVDLYLMSSLKCLSRLVEQFLIGSRIIPLGCLWLVDSFELKLAKWIYLLRWLIIWKVCCRDIYSISCLEIMDLCSFWVSWWFSYLMFHFFVAILTRICCREKTFRELNLSRYVYKRREG